MEAIQIFTCVDEFPCGRSLCRMNSSDNGNRHPVTHIFSLANTHRSHLALDKRMLEPVVFEHPQRPACEVPVADYAQQRLRRLRLEVGDQWS
jgi:hypothetical protein